jgi:hypothetical protein
VAWWLALHGVLLAAAAAVGAPPLAKLLAGVAVLAHALARRPARASLRLVWHEDGRWSVPERGLESLELAPGTRYTSLWVRLVLRGADGPLEVVLLSCQVRPAAWSALQARLRRGS